jgi:hypothetical protein
MIEIARAMFPLMPDEVFDEWLGGLIKLQGWPFTSIHDSTNVGSWAGQLLERPLLEWASFVWTHEGVEQVQDRIASVSRGLVMELMMHAHPQGSRAAGVIRNSEQRYKQAVEIMIEIKGFPGFVTAFEERGRLVVVDGHHRLAALCGFRGYKAISVPFWIARAAT